MPVWEQYTAQHRPRALLFPQRVSVRAEERTTELQDQPQLPNICFLPLHVKSEGLVSLYKHRDYYGPEVPTTAAAAVRRCSDVEV